MQMRFVAKAKGDVRQSNCASRRIDGRRVDFYRGNLVMVTAVARKESHLDCRLLLHDLQSHNFGVKLLRAFDVTHLQHNMANSLGAYHVCSLRRSFLTSV